jgi:hypothetical protein
METSPQPFTPPSRGLPVPQLEQAKEKMNELNSRAKAFIRERPGTCLFGAVAIGYLVGRIASRR